MRLAMIAVLVVSVCAAVSSGAKGGDDTVRAGQPDNGAISAVAQGFVARHHPSGDADRPRLSFSEPEIQRQPKRGKYAVFGGYMAFSGGAQPQPHAYGMTMRFTCQRYDDPACWQLEKLLIDKALVVDR